MPLCNNAVAGSQLQMPLCVRVTRQSCLTAGIPRLQTYPQMTSISFLFWTGARGRMCTGVRVAEHGSAARCCIPFRAGVVGHRHVDTCTFSCGCQALHTSKPRCAALRHAHRVGYRVFRARRARPYAASFLGPARSQWCPCRSFWVNNQVPKPPAQVPCTGNRYHMSHLLSVMRNSCQGSGRGACGGLSGTSLR